MNDMPGIPTNAPTTGPAAIIAWTLIGIALVCFVLRVLFPTGNERIHYRRAQDNQAITVLQDQVRSMQGEIAKLKLKVEHQAAEEEYNREYRHALASQVTTLLAWGELANGMLHRMFKEWIDCPDHYREQLEEMGTPKQIILRFPLPKERAPA
jgi:hypothetical protein